MQVENERQRASEREREKETVLDVKLKLSEDITKLCNELRTRKRITKIEKMEKKQTLNTFSTYLATPPVEPAKANRIKHENEQERNAIEPPTKRTKRK